MTPERRSLFRAFRSRNYALYFTGQSISQIGTWMQNTGISWVVYSLTHSSFMLGLTIFVSLFPRFVLSPLGGIVADRYNRYTVLLITQSASMLQAGVLAALVLSNRHAVWELLVLSAILGAINAFDSPARQPLLHEMVHDVEDLPNAVALNSSMVNFAVIVGPALSGIILVRYGAGFCFLVNALSFLAVIMSLLLMKLPVQQAVSSAKAGIARELAEGLAYLKRTPTLSRILAIMSLTSLLVLPYDVLLPIFAKEVYKGDADTFGYIRSFVGVGAIVGTFFLAALNPRTDLRRVLLATMIVLGIGMILFSLAGSFRLAMACAVVFGFGAMSQTTICLTIVQMQTEAAMRGRVMSFLIMAMTGMLPLGSLAVGAVSQRIGAPKTLLCQGILALVIGAGFARVLLHEKSDSMHTKHPERTLPS